MAADPLDDYIAAVGKALALPIEDAWRPAIRANLEVSLRLARLVDDHWPDRVTPADLGDPALWEAAQAAHRALDALLEAEPA